MSNSLQTPAQAAQAIDAELKRAFPDYTFSVVSSGHDDFDMNDHINIEIMAGPISPLVKNSTQKAQNRTELSYWEIQNKPDGEAVKLLSPQGLQLVHRVIDIALAHRQHDAGHSNPPFILHLGVGGWNDPFEVTG